MKRVFVPVLLAIAIFSGSSLRAQPGYSGILEYTLPLLTAMPPVNDSQPSDVANAYLWADQLMRTTQWFKIDRWIDSLHSADTLKFLAKMLYRVSDNNPLLLYQWEVSANPNSMSQHLSWNYKGAPATEVGELANQIGWNYGDSARAGFILDCDIIADVSISDTIVKNIPGDNVTPHMVMTNCNILDEIKGRMIPSCPMMVSKRKGETPLGNAIPIAAIPAIAGPGVCFRFEYSPEWSSDLAGDQLPYANQLQDSSGWWIKPGGEYILFLRLAGLGSDTSHGYFSVQPFWGVFGTQGAMYRVVSGHVIDPNDDFGLGGTNLTVTDWKSRLRARIYNILNP